MPESSNSKLLIEKQDEEEEEEEEEELKDEEKRALKRARIESHKRKKKKRKRRREEKLTKRRKKKWKWKKEEKEKLQCGLSDSTRARRWWWRRRWCHWRGSTTATTTTPATGKDKVRSSNNFHRHHHHHRRPIRGHNLTIQQQQKSKKRTKRRAKCEKLPRLRPCLSPPSLSPMPPQPPAPSQPLQLAPPVLLPDENESPTVAASRKRRSTRSNNSNNNNINNHCPPFYCALLGFRQQQRNCCQVEAERASGTSLLPPVSLSDMNSIEYFGCEQERRQVVAALDNDKEAAGPSPPPPLPKPQDLHPCPCSRPNNIPPPPAAQPSHSSPARVHLHRHLHRHLHQIRRAPKSIWRHRKQQQEHHHQLNKSQQCKYDQRKKGKYLIQHNNYNNSSNRKQEQALSRVKFTSVKLSFLLAAFSLMLVVQQQAAVIASTSGNDLEASATASKRRDTIERIDSLLLADSYYAISDESRVSSRPLDFVKLARTKQRQLVQQQQQQQQQQVDNNNQQQQQQQHGYKRHQRRQQHSGGGHVGSDRLKRHNSNLDGYDYLDSGGADRPLVATNKGLVRGITQKIFTGKFVDAFLGIPFAQPPIGAYRFKHPQPVNPWPGEFDASRMSNSCYQVNDTFFGANFMGTSIWNANTPLDEDCLYLNIWTPFGVANTSIAPPPRPASTSGATSGLAATSASTSGGGGNSNQNMNGSRGRQSLGDQDAKRAVLVWIFGGGFYSGTSTLRLYEGGALASEEDIIVVSMNYRVASLGFLYFGRPDAPGNAGLFDQLLALQWINDNIGQFGGDPQRVTIFGESAGAVSVAFHLLSPLSRNLFSQAILQSGAATCPWGSMDTREIIDNGLQLASLLKCPSDRANLDAVMSCLLKVEPMALVSQDVGQTRSVLNFPFVPVVDGSFLLEPPAESLANANFKRARILLGSNNDEANAFLVYLPEFSHCPGTGQASAPPPPPPTSLLPSSSSSSSGDNNSDSSSSSNNVGDSSDNSDEQLSSARHQRDAASAAAPTSGSGPNSSSSPSGVVQLLSSSSAIKTNQKQQQLQADLYAQNDSSESCKPNEYLSLNRDAFLEMLRENLNPYAAHPIAKKAIVFEYSNWNNPQDPVSYYDAIDKIVGDYYFTCHVNEFAHRYAQAGNAVYMYYFKHRSSMSPWPKWMGVLHADEINFVFGEPLNPVYNYTYKEVELSRRMMRYWANFAKFGEPTRTTPASSSGAVGDNISLASERWPEYKDKRQYFELNSDYIRVGRGPRSKQCAFWAQYLPQLIQSFDKNNQCQALDSQRLYDSSGRQQHRYSPSLPSSGHNAKRTAPIPSVILVSFIVILILIAVAGALIVVFKKRPSSWKLNLWPGSFSAGGGGNGSSSTGATSAGATGSGGGGNARSNNEHANDNGRDDDDDDDDDEEGRRSKRAGKSRAA